MPEITIIGGPNGIGKSSLAEEICREKDIEFLNPDHLFQFEFTNPDPGYFPYFLAGQVERLMEQNSSFLYESNLHQPQSFQILDLAKQYRYRRILLFMSTDDLGILIARVQERASQGLHDVPPDEIHRRYNASLELLPRYLSAFNEVHLFDGSGSPEDLLKLGTYNNEIFAHEPDIQELPEWAMRILSS